ncbi:MAG TPA: TonB family protein [Polyangiaceae bacterium]|nr:TonB family protein [Polyangiaceae bacterium]
MTSLPNLAERPVIVEANLETAPWLAWALGASIAFHALLYGALGDSNAHAARRELKSTVSFELASPPAPAIPEPPQPASTPVPESNPNPARSRPSVTTRVPSAPPPAENPPPPNAARTVDLTGITLAGDSGSFDAPLGNGESRTGPLAAIHPGRSPNPAPQAAELPAHTSEPKLVAMADLSAKPAAPELGAALRSNYPAEARRRGIAGTASVRARIDSDGVVRQVNVLGESFTGFAEACRRTLKGSRWSAPRDHQGQRVATEIKYTCRFLVTE